MTYQLYYDELNRGVDPLVAVTRMDEHFDTPLHEHDFTELVLVQEGTGFHITESQEYPLSAGDVYIILQGQSHGYAKTTGLRLINLMFKLEELAIEQSDLVKAPGYHALFRIEPGAPLHDKQPQHMKLSRTQWRTIMAILERLEEEADGGVSGHNAYARSLLTQIIIEIVRAWPGIAQSIAESVARLAEVFSYLEEHFAQKIYTESLTEIACMSLSTLQRRFRQVTGMSIIDYVNRLRIEHAKTLLREQGCSVTEAAYRVGFEDSNYFGKVFRRLSGITPGKFRALRHARTRH